MFGSSFSGSDIIYTEKGSKQPVRARIMAEWSRKWKQQIPVVIAM